MTIQAADELTTARGMVYSMASPRHPQFRFEWHPGVSRVYVVRKGVVPEMGELVAPNVYGENQAKVCVLAYCTGYDAGAAKIIGAQKIIQ